MGIARRRFMKLVARGAALLVPVAGVIRFPPVRRREPSDVYPGPRKLLREAEIRRTGRWGG